DQLGGHGVFPGQLLQRLVEVEEVVGRSVEGVVELVEGDAPPAAAPLEPALVPGAVEQDAAHGLGGGREEVPAGVPGRPPAGPHQPEVRLVDEGGRLEGLTRGLLGHPGGGELAQLVVDEREQVGRGLGVAGPDGRQDLGDVGHAAEYTSAGPTPRTESEIRRPGGNLRSGCRRRRRGPSPGSRGRGDRRLVYSVAVSPSCGKNLAIRYRR